MHQNSADFLNCFFIDRLDFGNRSECDGVSERSLGFRAMCCLFSLVFQMESSLIAQGEEYPIQCVLHSEKSSPTLFNPDRSDECLETETKINS